MNPDDTRKAEALAFLKAQDLGVLATYTPENGPSARALYYVADDSFNVFFLTLKNTRKVVDLAQSGRAAFTVYDRATPAAIQIEGSILDCTDSAKIDPIVVELTSRISAQGDHFAPVTHLDSSEIRFLKLTPHWIRYSDFSLGTGNKEVYFEIRRDSVPM